MSAFKWILVLSNLLEREVMAIIFRMQVVDDASFQKLEIETHNLQLVLLLQHHSSPFNSLGLLVDAFNLLELLVDDILAI